MGAPQQITPEQVLAQVKAERDAITNRMNVASHGLAGMLEARLSLGRSEFPGMFAPVEGLKAALMAILNAQTGQFQLMISEMKSRLEELAMIEKNMNQRVKPAVLVPPHVGGRQ
jgi:hypothetical protein